MPDSPIALSINGAPIVVEPRFADWTLLRYLREVLRLTGTKRSCDNEGTCGSCTVIVDGRARRACLEVVADLAGTRVETIESLQAYANGRPHPLVQTVIQDGIFQCGYCAPGAILAAKALLDSNPHPTQAEAVQALSAVICRCSALNRMDRSVLRAAAALRGEAPTGWTAADTENEHQALGKVLGTLRYTDDLPPFPGELYAQALRSPLPHARVRRVDVSRAARVPGVVRVLTAADLPGTNVFGLLIPDQPIFCDEVVRCVGDCLALVVAEDPDAAADALDLMDVELEPLPVIAGPEAALEPGAPVLHPRLRAEHPETPNVLWHHMIRKGDPAAGFAEADVVVEDDYSTPFVDHAFMEIECSVAVPQADGGVTVYCGSQGPTFDRAQVAVALGVPEERVRIAHMYTGGAFGGKEDVAGQVLAAVAARVTGRPVRVRWNRAESLRVHHKRHAEKLHYRMGATKDGRLVAAEVEILGDTGAYASTGEAVLFRSATFACGPYVVPHVKVDSYAIHTNNPICGAFRGFGGTQVAFASELHLQKLIEKLGADPLEFRIRNALDIGRATITGHVLTEAVGVGIRRCLLAVKEALDQTPRPEVGPDERLGIGIACAYKNVGLGSGIPDSAGARVSLEADGRFLVRHGGADIGQGSNEVMAILTAETLGVPLGQIRLHTGDTRDDPHGGMTTASRVTFVSGNATLKAARGLRGQLWSAVSTEFGVKPGNLVIRDGTFVDAESGRRLIGLVELAAGGERFECEAGYDATATNRVPAHAPAHPEAEPGDSRRHRLHFAYNFGAQAAMVAVNPRTGEVRVLKIIAAHDMGRPISRRNCIGQIEGAIVQGLGYALSESFPMKDGFPQVEDFHDLGLLRLRDLPEIQPILIDDPHPHGPLGAKGVGELALSPTAPAVVNAIHDAVGVWINDLPVTPEKVREALRVQGT